MQPAARLAAGIAPTIGAILLALGWMLGAIAYSIIGAEGAAAAQSLVDAIKRWVARTWRRRI